MARVWVTSALTVAGVVTAGSAAGLVNTRVLDSAEGQAVHANRVQLVEAQTWDAPPMASPRLATTVPATDPSTTTAVTTAAPVADGAVDGPSDPAVTDHDTVPAATVRLRQRPPAEPESRTVATTAAAPGTGDQGAGTPPPPQPGSTKAPPPTSIAPPTTGPRPRPSTDVEHGATDDHALQPTVVDDAGDHLARRLTAGHVRTRQARGLSRLSERRVVGAVNARGRRWRRRR